MDNHDLYRNSPDRLREAAIGAVAGYAVLTVERALQHGAPSATDVEAQFRKSLEHFARLHDNEQPGIVQESLHLTVQLLQMGLSGIVQRKAYTEAARERAEKE
jgi:hypothetical protein